MKNLWPDPAELGWYAVIRRMRSWSRTDSEAEVIRRSVELARRLASVCGLPSAPMSACFRGLAHTVYFRTQGLSIVDRLTDAGLSRWRAFTEEMRSVDRAIFITAHVGPFQLQMDLLSTLEKEITLIYRSYRWGPLKAEVESLRLASDRFSYVETVASRRIAAAFLSGRSLAFLGDVPRRRPGRALRLFEEEILDDAPVRLALRRGAPMFVGGLYTEEHAIGSGGDGLHRFGVTYTRVDPADAAGTAASYAAAM